MVSTESSNPSTRRLSAPNLVTGLRVIGSPALVLLAMNDQPVWVAVVVTALVFTEWLDGFLARTLHQESAFGARLDTVADASFYTSLLVALVILNHEAMHREAGWIAAAIGAYALSWLVALFKFGNLPSYHTWAAKAAWLVVGAGVICLIADWAAWPFRVAMFLVVLANLEAVMITLVLRAPRVDVPSLWHARRG